ncbi:MAG: outer membrane lipoprotein carrier protein LolA [Gammaproteobacteria bacterium]|nr:outer membrane lipoprotein carrier protein LolA [Gammaproteobacteria bacterium]MBI5615126.1 outer membrane lipoprotein carrier protein LolA [Gammaproteobacteria bacterium]
MNGRRALVLGVCLLIGVTARVAAGDWDLDALMAARREVRSSSARFVERKYLRLLMERLESSGRLRYVAPDRLERITEKPAAETFELSGSTITGTQRNGERYTLSLAEHPEVAALVEGVRATLAGDLPTLQRHYAVSLAGDRARWQLRLVPYEQIVREKIDDIVIGGADVFLTTVEVHEKDGDRSEMTIQPDGP